MKSDHLLEEHFFGVATIGERGQLVIPAEARKKLGLNPGDKVLVMEHPVAHGLVLFRIDALRELMNTHLESLSKLEASYLTGNNGDNNNGTAG